MNDNPGAVVRTQVCPANFCATKSQRDLAAAVCRDRRSPCGSVTSSSDSPLDCHSPLSVSLRYPDGPFYVEFAGKAIIVRHPERRTKSVVEPVGRHKVSGSLIDRLSRTPHPSCSAMAIIPCFDNPTVLFAVRSQSTSPSEEVEAQCSLSQNGRTKALPYLSPASHP